MTGIDESVQKSLREALMTIQALPSEIMCSIFMYLHDIEPPLSPSETRTHVEVKRIINHEPALSLDSQYLRRLSRLGWLKVTSVSRYWRSLAISDVALWKRLPFVLGRRWVDEFLARSRGATVDVLLDQHSSFELYRNASATGCIQHVLSVHRHRIRCLVIDRGQIMNAALRRGDLSAQALLDALCDFIAQPSDSIEKLRLYSSSKPFDLENDMLFAGRASRFRDLQLDLTYLPSASFDWETLTRFSLTTMQLNLKNPWQGLLMRKLLNALLHMPSLETLALSSAPIIEWISPHESMYLKRTASAQTERVAKNEDCVCDAASVRQVDLPVLRELTLSSSVSCVLHTLQHIIIPMSARLNLVFSGNTLRGAPLTSLLPFVRPRSLDQMTFRHLSFDGAYPDGPSGISQFFSTFEASRTESSTAPPDLRLHFTVKIDPDFQEDLLQAFAPSSTRALSLTNTRALSYGPLIGRMGNLLDSVTHIRITSHRLPDRQWFSVEKFKVQLSELLLGAAEGRVHNAVPFQSLVSLDLPFVNLQLFTTPCRNLSEEASSQPLNEILGGIMSERRRRGAQEIKVFLHVAEDLGGREGMKTEMLPSWVQVVSRRAVVLPANAVTNKDTGC